MTTSVGATPNIPEAVKKSATINSSIKVATPDIILFDDATLPESIITDLLFEQIGGQEIITIARHDLVNGQNISYNLIGNTSIIQQLYNPQNMFKLSGSIKEFFENFGIRFGIHVPENGTGPAPYYVGAEDSHGVTGFPVLDAYDDTVDDSFGTFAEAQEYIDATYPTRDIVYSDPETGNIVVDVTNMKINERVDVELQISGTLEDDTIY
jgi:hypothetical protein